MHAEYSARIEIFGLYFWDGVNDDTATVESNTPAEKDLWEDAKSFAPTLIISPETIGPLFFDSFDPAIVSKFSLPDFHNVNDTLRRRFSDSWLNAIKDESAIKNYVTPALSMLAFWRSLAAAKILNFYSFKATDQFTSCTVGSFSHANSVKYFETLEPIFTELKSKPPIFQFVYYLLLDRLVPGMITSVNIDQVPLIIENLWQLTGRLVIGLTELARNIVQHSSKQKGAITLRLYTKEAWQEFATLNPHALLGSHTGLSDARAILDINVIDLGEHKVTDSLAASLAEWLTIELPESLLESFESDRKRLNENTVTLQDLIDPEGGILLDHQARRAVAHLGLQTFAGVVKENGGRVVASSSSIGLSYVAGHDFATVPAGWLQPTVIDSVKYGTNFNVLIPVDPDRQYGTRLSGALPTLDETTPMGMQQLDTLFNVVTEPNDPDINTTTGAADKDVLSIYKLPSCPLEDRIDEFRYWAEQARKIPIRFHLARFRALDMSNLPMTASQLFRFLGRFELDHPGRHLIVFNLSAELFLELNSINDAYALRGDVAGQAFPYWNATAVTLVYNYVQAVETKFHLCDALWGETKDDFLGINRVIRNTNFNSVSLAETDHGRTGATVNDLAKRLKHVDLFQDGMSLKPFDLLLAVEGTTLFEHNARFLLMNELDIEGTTE